MPRMHPPYPERFRREAVELVRKSGRAGSRDRHARSWAMGVVRARYSGLLPCMEACRTNHSETRCALIGRRDHTCRWL